MKKIPTLFERDFSDDHTARAKPVVTPGLEWVLRGEGEATVKYDGACCAIINGKFYKRYDAKHGKPVPDGAIKCQENADPVTGHLPCWVKCDRKNPADKWFWAAYDNSTVNKSTQYMTCEAVGPHFQGNPYDYDSDFLIPHGSIKVNVMNSFSSERTFEGIKKYLSENEIEGIVFWKDGEPKCKIKRTDFGFPWNGNYGTGGQRMKAKRGVHLE